MGRGRRCLRLLEARPETAPRAQKPDAAVESWVKVLTEKMNDPHDTIRDSARAGLLAVGRPAVVSLQKLAEGDDAAKANTARNLIAQIERQELRP